MATKTDEASESLCLIVGQADALFAQTRLDVVEVG